MLDGEHGLPVSLITRRQGGWNLGVLEEGKAFAVAITRGGTPLARQEFVASCGEAVALQAPPAAGKE